jgi:hypothetical protein
MPVDILRSEHRSGVSRLSRGSLAGLYANGLAFPWSDALSARLNSGKSGTVWKELSTAHCRCLAVTGAMHCVPGPQLGAGSGACWAWARSVSQACNDVLGGDLKINQGKEVRAHLHDTTVTLAERTPRIDKAECICALNEPVRRGDLRCDYILEGLEACQ